jgi:hypothetical protein
MVQIEILTVVDNVLCKVFQKVLRKVFYLQTIHPLEQFERLFQDE